MVMIDLTEEKKSLGVISVTRVTSSSRLQRADEDDPLAFAQVRWGGFVNTLVPTVRIRQLALVKKK
jgi:hypothetical protein